VIIGQESVLRRIPAALARTQSLFIEGIRFSIEMADLAHSRLRETLPPLSRMENPVGESPSSVSAMLDAWSIVDSLHRLRGLLRHMPGSRDGTGFRPFGPSSTPQRGSPNSVIMCSTSIRRFPASLMIKTGRYSVL